MCVYVCLFISAEAGVKESKVFTKLLRLITSGMLVLERMYVLGDKIVMFYMTLFDL